MKAFGLFFASLLTCLLIASLLEAETYYIGRDAGGIYFQTDQDGGWYIDRKDLDNFKIGENGTYSIKADRYGIYINTDKGKKFYIDLEAKAQLDREIERFNEETERKALQNETRVIIKGNQVLVPVILGYGGNETESLLLLDTGASIIALHREVADELKIKDAQKSKFVVFGGQTIPTHVTKLSYIKVGPFKKENIYCGIIEYENSSLAHQGLLGMNFLRNLKYHIDFKKQSIIWK
jgi:predicted aspartyl protease